MADIHKLTYNGETILPATTTEAIIHPQLEASLSVLTNEYNLSSIFPTAGVDGTGNYTIGLAVEVLGAKLPAPQKVIGTKISFTGITGVAEFWACYRTPFDSPDSWMQLAIAPRTAEVALLSLETSSQVVILGLPDNVVSEVSRNLATPVGTEIMGGEDVIFLVGQTEAKVREIIGRSPGSIVILGTPLQERGNLNTTERVAVREMALDFSLPLIDLNAESGVSGALELENGPWYTDAPDHIASQEFPEYNWTDRDGNIVAQENLTAEIKSYGRCTIDGSTLSDTGIKVVGKYISGNLKKYM